MYLILHTQLITFLLIWPPAKTKRPCEKVSVSFYLELLQGAESGVEAVLRQAAGQKIDPRLFWSLSVHLFRIHIKVLQEEEEAQIHKTLIHSLSK